jgi:hypothetical protein
MNRNGNENLHTIIDRGRMRNKKRNKSRNSYRDLCSVCVITNLSVTDAPVDGGEVLSLGQLLVQSPKHLTS